MIKSYHNKTKKLTRAFNSRGSQHSIKKNNNKKKLKQQIVVQSEFKSLLDICYGIIGYNFLFNNWTHQLMMKKSLPSGGKLYPNEIYVIDEDLNLLYRYNHTENQLIKEYDENTRSENGNVYLLITGSVLKGWEKYAYLYYKILLIDSGILIGNIIGHLSEYTALEIIDNFDFKTLSKKMNLERKKEIPIAMIKIINNKILRERQTHSQYVLEININDEVENIQNVYRYFNRLNNETFSNVGQTIFNIEHGYFSTSKIMLENYINRKSILNTNGGLIKVDIIVNLLYFMIDELYKFNIVNRITPVVVVSDKMTKSILIEKLVKDEIVVLEREDNDQLIKFYNERNIGTFPFIDILFTYNFKENSYRTNHLIIGILIQMIILYITKEKINVVACPMLNFDTELYKMENSNGSLALSLILTEKPKDLENALFIPV